MLEVLAHCRKRFGVFAAGKHVEDAGKLPATCRREFANPFIRDAGAGKFGGKGDGCVVEHFIRVGNRGPQISFDRPEKSPCLTRIKDPSKRAEALAIIESGRLSLQKLPPAN